MRPSLKTHLPQPNTPQADLRRGRTPLRGLVLGGLAPAGLSVMLASPAIAAPPPAERAPLSRSVAPSVVPRPAQGAPDAPRLDLRAPASVTASADSSSFPSSNHRLMSVARAAQSLQASAIGVSMRSRSNIQEMAEQFHREGLPVARLMETNTSLLHLGLNQKGKPGLWFIEKLR